MSSPTSHEWHILTCDRIGQSDVGLKCFNMVPFIKISKGVETKVCLDCHCGQPTRYQDVCVDLKGVQHLFACVFHHQYPCVVHIHPSKSLEYSWFIIVILMFEISGNIHISLADISSIHGLPDHTVHLTTVISSPEVVIGTTYSELSKFHIILHSHGPDPPPALFEPDTEVFFTGELTSGPAGSFPMITVKRGQWGLHNGRHFALAEEFHKARVWGAGYVVGVCLNLLSRRRSYLTVLDPSQHQVSILCHECPGIFTIIVLTVNLSEPLADFPHSPSCLGLRDTWYHESHQLRRLDKVWWEGWDWYVQRHTHCGLNCKLPRLTVHSPIMKYCWVCVLCLGKIYGLEVLGRSSATRYSLRPNPKKVRHFGWGKDGLKQRRRGGSSKKKLVLTAIARQG